MGSKKREIIQLRLEEKSGPSVTNPKELVRDEKNNRLKGKKEKMHMLRKKNAYPYILRTFNGKQHAHPVFLGEAGIWE